MNVISSDSGSATTGISVSVARPRKMKMTITTRTNAMSSVSCTSCTSATIVWERSNVGMRLIEPGSSRRSCGSSSRIDFATSTAFAPAWRETARTMVEPGIEAARAEVPRDPLVLHAVGHGRDVPQVDRRVIGAAGDDQVAVTFGVRDLRVRPEEERASFAVKLTGARVGRARPESPPDRSSSVMLRAASAPGRP